MFIKKHAKKLTLPSWQTVWGKIQSDLAKRICVLIVGWFLLSALIFIAITPQRYDVRIGDIAHTTITASKDVVDEVTTTKQREIAAKSVEPSYVFMSNVYEEVMADLKAVLAQVTSVQQYGQKLLVGRYGENSDRYDDYVFSTEEMEVAKGMLTRITFADYQLRTLLHTSTMQMNEINSNITAAIDNSLNTTIREGYESDAIQYMQQIIGYQTDLDLLQNVVTPILREVIEPNMVIDQAATEKLQEEARAAVEPVIYKQGQNIVLAREKITSTQWEMLRSLGLIDDGYVDVIMYVGAGMLIALGLLLLCSMLWLLDRQTLYSLKRLIILLLILAITLLLCIFGQMINPYFVPTLLAVMMITGLLGASTAIAGCFTVSLLIVALIAASDGAYGTETVNLLLTTFTSGILCIILIQRRPYRMHMLMCGVITAASNYVVMLAIGFMTNTSISDVFLNGIWSSGSAIMAAVLCIALDPLLESFFHLATPAKLLELSNPNHPLLRRLLIEASGTYHHSIIVANLAEAAAEDIGANPLLARVGAYFHDIGKLKRPLYFKENQMGENPHDHTNPYVSAAIVTAHTRDGLAMAQQAHLPQEILDIIEEHHGDTPVMFFYHAACQQSQEQNVDIADFRYNGKRPHSKESAIVMLADTVEAAVRSLPDPTPQSIRQFITKLVTGKMNDDQLTQAPLTLSDVTKICDAFSKVLNGVFHERIEYPSISVQAAAKVAAQLPKEDTTKAKETQKHAN